MTKINLARITKKFGKAYDQANKYATQKDLAQGEFFRAIDQVLEDHVRRQLLVTLESGTSQEFVEKNYPGYRLVEKHGDQLLIEEDPRFMKFSYINAEDGTVYARTVAQAGTSLDDQRLREEDPQLWENITEWPDPWYSLIRNFTLNQGYSRGEEELDLELDQYLKESGLQKMLKNPDLWTPEELESIEKYMVPGKLSIRLVKPRPATQEELDLLV